MNKTRFSETEAETFIEFFESKTEEKIAEKKDDFMVKQDKIELIEKMNRDKVDLIEKMNNIKTGMIKWMSSIFLALALLIIGLYLKK